MTEEPKTCIFAIYIKRPRSHHSRWEKKQMSGHPDERLTEQYLNAFTGNGAIFGHTYVKLVDEQGREEHFTFHEDRTVPPRSSKLAKLQLATGKTVKGHIGPIDAEHVDFYDEHIRYEITSAQHAAIRGYLHDHANMYNLYAHNCTSLAIKAGQEVGIIPPFNTFAFSPLELSEIVKRHGEKELLARVLAETGEHANAKNILTLAQERIARVFTKARAPDPLGTGIPVSLGQRLQSSGMALSSEAKGSTPTSSSPNKNLGAPDQRNL